MASEDTGASARGTEMMTDAVPHEACSADAAVAGSTMAAHPRRFSESLAAVPPADWLADLLAGPALAAAWADAIVCFWEAEYANGSLDPAHPAILLDLEPARGSLAWLLVQALDQRLPRSRVPALRFRYLACVDHEAMREWLGGHPQLAALRQQGQFDTVSALEMQGQDGVLGAARNPCVVLALGLFQRLPAELHAVHYGDWLEGEVLHDNEVDADAGQACQLSYAWRSTSPDQLDARCKPLAAHYLANMISAPVLLPVAGLAWLEWVEGICERGYLLLAADPGALSEQQLRAGALTPPAAWTPGESVLPVNYHALAWYQRQHGAAVYQRQTSEAGIVLHAAWRGNDGASLGERLELLHARLDSHHPEDRLHLAATAAALAETAPLDTLLTWLRMSDYDPRVLAAWLPAWVERPPSLTYGDLARCREALVEVWRHYLLDPDDLAFIQQLGLAAMWLGAWRLAIDIFRGGLACDSQDVAGHYYLAQCLAATGDVRAALESIGHAVVLAPDNRRCRAMERLLRARLTRWAQLPWYRPEIAEDGELRLEPLGPEHADAVLSQYGSDPQISVMTRLPELNDRRETLAWIDEQRHQPGRMNYAVMHEERGLVGVVCLYRAGSASYFYFWIGGEAQGQGLGSRAARCLFAQARAAGIDDVFTSAYLDNARSLRALEHLGFCRLPVAAVDEDDLLFLHLPLTDDAMASADSIEKLKRLCGAIESSFSFLPASDARVFAATTGSTAQREV